MGFWNGVGKVGNLRAFEYWVLDKREIKENDGREERTRRRTSGNTLRMSVQ
jgi:hypothetical protein